MPNCLILIQFAREFISFCNFKHAWKALKIGKYIIKKLKQKIILVSTAKFMMAMHFYFWCFAFHIFFFRLVIF